MFGVGPTRLNRGIMMARRPTSGPRSGGQPGGGRSGGGRPGGGRPTGRGANGGDSRRGPAQNPRGGRPDIQRDGGRGGGGARPEGGRQSAPKGLGGIQVEGRQAVRELLLAGRRKVREVVISAEVQRGDIIDDIYDLAHELRVVVTEVSRGKLDAQSRTDAPQGVIAYAAELPDVALDDLLRPVDGRPPFLLALDGVTDPGNLGALLRIGECAGVTGVILPKHRAVHITPTVTKSAVGAIEYLPMALVGGLPAAMRDLTNANITVVGLDAGGSTDIHNLPDLPHGVCLVLGAEGKGLSRLVSERADIVASIPQYGRLDSLNVSAAGAVAAFEVARRRG